MARRRQRATPPCKDWEPPPGGWRTPNADKARAAQQAVPVVIIGSTEDVRDFLFGPQDHREHLTAYKWHQFMGDREARWQAVKDEFKRMHGKEMEET